MAKEIRHGYEAALACALKDKTTDYMLTEVQKIDSAAGTTLYGCDGHMLYAHGPVQAKDAMTKTFVTGRDGVPAEKLFPSDNTHIYEMHLVTEKIHAMAAGLSAMQKGPKKGAKEFGLRFFVNRDGNIKADCYARGLTLSGDVGDLMMPGVDVVAQGEGMGEEFEKAPEGYRLLCALDAEKLSLACGIFFGVTAVIEYYGIEKQIVCRDDHHNARFLLLPMRVK